MQALSDTHTLLWWMLDNPALSPACRQIIANPDTTIYVSLASVWEIAIKYQLGKLPLPQRPEIFLPKKIVDDGFHILPITMEQVLRVGNLPMIHRDPFDRLLIAQAQIENLPILTTDETIRQYAVATLW